MRPRAIDVKPLEDYMLLIKFSNGEEKVFEMPKICPVCGAEAVREDDEAVIRCTGIECPAMLFRSLVHFASREAMNIDGLGPAIIEQLLDRGLINNIADIYSLTAEDIETLDKMGEKSAQNLINAINIFFISHRSLS